MLHAFAAGTANYTVQSIGFALHAKRNDFVYWPGELSGLDRGSKTVELGPITLPNGHSKVLGRSISYDTLVLAIGPQLDMNSFLKGGVGWLADDLTRMAGPLLY